MEPTSKKRDSSNGTSSDSEDDLPPVVMNSSSSEARAGPLANGRSPSQSNQGSLPPPPPPPVAAVGQISPMKHYRRYNDVMNKSTAYRKESAELCKKIQGRESLDRELSRLRDEGGIRAKAERVRLASANSSLSEEASSRAKEEGREKNNNSCNNSASSPADVSTASNDDAECKIKMNPPGIALFERAPSLISELCPPCLDYSGKSTSALEQFLLQDDPAALKEIILGNYLSLCYRGSAFPQAVWNWLFQVMCCSEEEVLRQEAYRSLLRVSVGASTPSGLAHPPLPRDVAEVLEQLGTRRLSGLPTCLDTPPLPPPGGVARMGGAGGKGGEATEDPEEDSVFGVAVVSETTVSNLVSYLTVCLQSYPALYGGACGSRDVEQLIVTLLCVSLDQSLQRNYHQGVKTEITHCVGAALAVIPDAQWEDSMERLARDAMTISTHHHNRLHMAQVISGSSDRQKSLQRLFCKSSVVDLLKLEVPPLQGLGDNECSPAVLLRRRNTAFLQRVTARFIADHKDYYLMFSVLSMMLLLVGTSEMAWASKEAKTTFLKQMSKLSERLRDNLDSPDLSIVKDLLIRCKLDLANRKQSMEQTHLSF